MEPEVGDYFKKQGYRKKEGHYLDVEKVIQIFAMLSCDVPAQVIGAHFAVSTQMIYHIKNGNRWGWVRDKLLEDVGFDNKLRHDWIPDVKHQGKFLCHDCGMRYDRLFMNAKCPVRVKQDDQPIYLSWTPPAPKKPKTGKRSIPGADLQKVRAYKRKELREIEKFNAKMAARQARHDEKEARRQQLIREVNELRRKNERLEIEERKKRLAESLLKPPAT